MVDLIEMAKSTRTALYVWCDDDTSFTYLNYLSVASVMRYYMMILYETLGIVCVVAVLWMQHFTDDTSSILAITFAFRQCLMKETRPCFGDKFVGGQTILWPTN